MAINGPATVVATAPATGRREASTKARAPGT